MKIVVLNGSPKGDLSVTMQYILYFQKKFPQHEFKILNVAQQIKHLEQDQQKFHKIINEIKESDGIIWGTPVYVLLVPSQYKRFIELIIENNAEGAFKDKYTVALTTSIHFFDHTAHNYIHAICDDLGMKYVGKFSPDMNDLMTAENRIKLILFAENFFYAIENNIPTSKHFPPLNYRNFNYNPSESENEKHKISTEGKKILILTDSTDEQTNLGKMIKTFQNSFSGNIDIINIFDIDIKGGCLGCLQCGYDNQCAYKDKDEFMEFWNLKLKASDILVFAGNIKDRYISSRWKMVFDRAFFNNHVPTLIGKQIAFIISGPLSQIPNINQIFQAYIESQGSNCVNFITDEFGDSAELDSLLQNFAHQLIRFSDSNYIQPETFLSVGGKLIFRDAVYTRLRLVFRADDKYYEEHGFYNTFPQNDKRAKEMNEQLIPVIENNEKFRKKFYSMINKAIINPIKTIVDDPSK
ncbi:MAG: NAD(P)H-dependent oxidoreductase [Promethearchaeota archaeon]